MKIKNILSDLVHLFYPHVCAGCGSDVLDEQNLLCIQCITNLPHTNFAQQVNNQIEKIFYGRISLIAAHSEFYFTKDSIIQQLIHQLKYKNNKAIGIYLGKIMGNSLLESNRFKDVDALIPLPMFINKQHKRGYNQAALICEGVAAVTDIPILYDNLYRQHTTQNPNEKKQIREMGKCIGQFCKVLFHNCVSH